MSAVKHGSRACRGRWEQRRQRPKRNQNKHIQTTRFAEPSSNRGPRSSQDQPPFDSDSICMCKLALAYVFSTTLRRTVVVTMYRQCNAGKNDLVSIRILTGQSETLRRPAKKLYGRSASSYKDIRDKDYIAKKPQIRSVCAVERLIRSLTRYCLSFVH